MSNAGQDQKEIVGTNFDMNLNELLLSKLILRNAYGEPEVVEKISEIW